MQKTTGTISPGAHPGSYNGQDAYNDLLVVDDGSLLRGERTTAPNGVTGNGRCAELYARSADNFRGGVNNMQHHETRYCKYCGKPMERKRWSNGELQSWQHYNKQVYCGKECQSMAWKTKEHKGESWMTIHYLARRLLPDGCCEICGSNKNVDVHHRDGNPKNNSPDNLQRLCRSCHIKAHRKRGTCSICGKEAKGYGYCNKHYIRFKKYGDPTMFRGKKGVM